MRKKFPRSPLSAKPLRKSPKQELFLKAYSKCGIVSMAARQVKISATSHYRWMASDPTYGERFAAARETAIEHLEELLLREAENGNIAAIIFALKAARPAVYRDNYRLEVSGPNGAPIATAGVGQVEHYLHLSDEQLMRIAASGLDEAELVPTALPESNGHIRITGPEPG
jgi:hypothetical protein